MILVNIRFFVIFSMRGIWAKFFIVLCVVCGLGVASSGYAADERPVVRIGLVDTFSPEFYINTYAATIQYLKRQLPQYRFESVEFTNVDSFTRAEALTLDFLVSSAGTFGIRAQEFGAEHIVIRKRSDVKNASSSVAAVFVARADNKSINMLQDMRHKRVTATNPSSFDGWLIAQDELSQAGFSPDQFFSNIQFTEYNYPDVISRVLIGQADVGVLTRCQLERYEQQGLVPTGAVKVINGKDEAGEPCRRSSDLYPAEVIAYFRIRIQNSPKL